jgi:predicted nucleic acid-binding protein
MLVSNTSTLVLMAKVGCLEKFIGVSPAIKIPIQVKREALFEENSYYAKLIEKLIRSRKIEVVKVDKTKTKDIMVHFKLDEGEAAAYALFNKKIHKAILTDDGELIKLCKLEDIPFICAMAVIIRLFEKEVLSREEALNKLQKLNIIGRYSEELYEHFKAEVR